MKSPRVSKHPMMEIIARKLFGLEHVPLQEQRSMINRAAHAAADYHDERMAELRADAEKVVNAAKARLEQWTRETYVEIQEALDEWDKKYNGKPKT